MNRESCNNRHASNTKEKQMTKLIRAYQQSPYAPQARALLAYLNKHMMAECMATADEQLVIQHVRSINWH